MDLSGKVPKIAIAAACLAGSVAAGVLASAYTTAGMDPYYTQRQYEAPGDIYPGSAYGSRTALAERSPDRLELADSGPADSPSYPPIPSR